MPTTPHVQNAKQPTRAQAIEKLADILTDYRVCMLVTRDASEDVLRGRPMALRNDRFDGTLWFLTDSRSHKVDEVEQERDVCVVISDPSQKRSVSVSGRAFLSQDRAKIRDIWTETDTAWFPEGPDGEHVALLRVEVTAAEYWDAPDAKVVQLFGIAKAYVTGEPYKGEGAENAKLDL